MKEQKELGRNDFTKIPNGAPGVENRVPLIYNGGVVENRISLNRFVELTSTAAAKMFGLFPKKGTIAVGSDADIVIFDGEKEQTLGLKTSHMISNRRINLCHVQLNADLSSAPMLLPLMRPSKKSNG